MLAHPNPEHLLDEALDAFGRTDEREWRRMLDELPVPIYTADPEGRVTYWNRACIDFAGREPQLGKDRWCVTWQLYTMVGERLLHEDCPMALAIREQRPVRDSIAIAERPDGKRVAFRPYPTPLFDADGNFAGAVNMLIDVTAQQGEALHRQAERCRRLADATYDRRTSKLLDDMAEGFERTAGKLSPTS